MTPNKETVSMLTEALAHSYGLSIANAVVNELGLDPESEDPLPLYTARRAREMAQTCNDTLTGVDFVTKLLYSAVSHGRGFTRVCESLDLEPTSIDVSARQQIDTTMQQRFAKAAARNQTPVSPDTAQRWLHDILRA